MDTSDFKILRGERLLQWIEEEESLEERSNYNQLYQSAVRAFPRTRKRQHATGPIQIVRMDFTPYVGTRNLLVRGQARSGTYNNVYYKPMLFFNEVQYEEEENQQNVSLKATTGEDYNIQPINLRDNIVRVRCDCLDFYFRFSPWNFSNDDIYGPKPKPYVRKTNHYPPANPSRSPGICKHVMKLAQACEESGLVRR